MDNLLGFYCLDKQLTHFAANSIDSTFILTPFKWLATHLPTTSLGCGLTLICLDLPLPLNHHYLFCFSFLHFSSSLLRFFYGIRVLFYLKKNHLIGLYHPLHSISTSINLKFIWMLLRLLVDRIMTTIFYYLRYFIIKYYI